MTADRVTDRGAVERFAPRLAQGALVVVEGAEHEILIERDALRDQFWGAFDAFVDDLAGARRSTPAAAP